MHILEELGFGAGRIAYDTNVDIAAQRDSLHHV